MTARPRILIVEDDGGVQNVLGIRFKKIYEIVSAFTQEEAHAALQQQGFDLVLLDLKLPRTKTDMSPSTEVGIAILAHIREQKLLHRGGDMKLPVVVMTAHGSERLFSAEFLGERGANDYVRKPFGEEDEPAETIARALRGERVFSKDSIVHVYFHPYDKIVRVEKFEYRGPHFELLAALRENFEKDWDARTAPEFCEGLRGDELADRWQLSDQAVRQRVTKFRDEVKEDFRRELGRTLYKDDIVENERRGNGYRLNPIFVRIVPWAQEMGAKAVGS